MSNLQGDPGTPQRPPSTSASSSAGDLMEQSQQPPQPADGGQLGADTTKTLAQDGQTLSQIGIVPLLTPGVSPTGGGGNVQSDDPESPGKLNPTTGNKTAPPPRATHAAGTGVIRGPIPPMSQPPTRSGRK
jgi:hypothetical protein